VFGTDGNPVVTEYSVTTGVEIGTAARIALWVLEVVDFKSIKTSRHGMAPWTATIRENGRAIRI
jgi:hypothetical protein